LAAIAITIIVLGIVFGQQHPALRKTAGALLFFIWLVLLPGLGAYVAFKKKRKTLGILCLAIVGYGFIIAIVAFFISPAPPVGPLPEQCPRCRGQVGTVEPIKVERGTNKKRAPLAYTILVAVLGGLVGLFLIVWAFFVWSEGDDGIIQWTYGATVAGLGVFSLGLILIGWGVGAVLRHINGNWVEAVRYKCSQCKFKWDRAVEGQEAQTVGSLAAGGDQSPPE
jgi:hypothetical protein